MAIPVQRFAEFLPTHESTATCACAALELDFEHLNMTSLEHNCCTAYSEDLRWRVLWQTEALGRSDKEAASSLGVDRSTVSRLRQKWLTTGSISKKTYPTEKAHRKLTEPVQILILSIVITRPELLLTEVQKEIQDLPQVDIDISIICRFLHRSGFTRKKLQYVASQRDELC